MSQSRLSLNINVQYVKNWDTTLEFLKALDPFAVTAVIDTKNAMPRVRELKAALPNAVIVVRCVIIVDGRKELDGGMHLQPQAVGDTNHYIVSPGNFLNEWGELGKDGFILSYMNEPQTTNATPENITRQVQHIIETINLANQRGIALCVGNWGVAQDPDNDAFLPVFELLSKNRQHVLGIHLYAPIDTYQAISRIVNRCKNADKPFAPPRIHVTEFGFDTTGPTDPQNGYKSRGMTGGQFAEWCSEKLRNMLGSFIADNIVEVVEVFGWGYDASYHNFDVETDSDWQKAILDIKNKGLLSIPSKTPQPEPMYTPDPFTAGESYKINTPGAYINVRATPSISSAIMGQVSDGDIVTVYEETLVAGEYWRKVGFGALKGYVSMQSGTVRLFPYVPPPVITPPVVEETVTVTLTKAEYAAWLAFRAAMERAAVQTVTVNVKAAA